MKRKAILGTIISVVFLWLALRKVEFSQLVDVVSGAKWEWLIPNIILVVGVMWIRAWRWQMILRPVGKVPYARVYSSTMIGFMVNNVLPARLGEIARAVSLAIKANLSRSATLATIVVERIYDSFTLLLFLWFVFAFSRISELTEVGRVRYIGWIFLAINIALLIVMITLQVKNDTAVRWIRKISSKFSPKIQKVAGEVTEKFARGLRMHHDVKTTVGVGLTSLVIWFILGISNYFVLLALGFDLPVEASFVVLVVVSLMISIPSSPGYVGVFHWAVQISLQIYGLSEGEALAVAIVLHAAQYIPITLLGLYYLRNEHLTLSTVGGEESDATPATTR